MQELFKSTAVIFTLLLLTSKEECILGVGEANLTTKGNADMAIKMRLNHQNKFWPLRIAESCKYPLEVITPSQSQRSLKSSLGAAANSESVETVNLALTSLSHIKLKCL